jgi:HAD superfamily hydrolase (TIGR01509 family)
LAFLPGGYSGGKTPTHFIESDGDRMIRGVIFDLDGTLLDSMHVWKDVGERFLKKRGIVSSINLYEEFKTMSLLQAAQYVKKEFNLKDSEQELMDEINRFVEEGYFYEVQLKAHAKDFLKSLHKKGYKMCIATATDRYMVQAALDRLGIRRYFSFITTCTEVGAGKDSPAIYEHALKKLGLLKSETVVFEDALHAIQTAVNAGFYVIGVVDAFALEAPEIRRVARRCIESFAECEIDCL